ncbi:MAG: hypothetical protein IPL40_05525 [Proteobacteria bacterium]|nr:hypothetical protein [Pseudomonadota bacterium]
MLTLYASRLRFDVDCAWRASREALRAVFAPCSRPLLAPTERVAITVDDLLQVSCNGEAVAEAAGPGDLLPVLEHLFYRELLARSAPALALHAAALVAPTGEPTLLLGASGAGKSTLARALLRAGWDYLGDDLAFVEGAQLWGLPRAIQFNPIALDETPAPLLAGCDLRTCIYHAADGRTLALPLAPVPTERLAAGPAPVSGLRLVLVEPSDPLAPDALAGAGAELRSCAPLEALAALHLATLTPLAERAIDLASLIRPGRSQRLVWRDPAVAAALLSPPALPRS